MIIEPGFETVAETFMRLTADQPYGGAALAIFQDGKPIIDIYAGESRPGVPWDASTKSVVFSTSKGLLSILCHRLVQDGLLDLD